MCGIVGLGDFKPKAGQYEHNLFAQMMVGNALRGTDSTGIMKVYSNGHSDWRKQTGYPYHLWESKGFPNFWKDYEKKEVRYLIGHCRSATVGDPNVKNAHPFTVDHISLVHNGTLAKSSKLPDYKDFAVDSEAICHSIAKQGIQKTVDGMDGAFSLVYYDAKEKTLNFIRNFERPMFIGKQEGIGRLFFGSEEMMIKWILDRNNIVPAQFEELPTYTLYSFSLDSLKPKIKKVTKSFFSGPLYSKVWIKGVAYDSLEEFHKIQELQDANTKPTLGSDSVDFSAPSLPAPATETAEASPKGKVVPFSGKKKPKTKGEPGKGTFFANPLLRSANLVPVNNLFGLRKDERIALEIENWDKVPGADDKYLFECASAAAPNTQVFFYLMGKRGMETLIETGKLSARIVGMQQNTKTIQDLKEFHRIWVADPIPKFSFEIEAEDAEIISESELQEAVKMLNEAQQLHNRRDPALGD